MVLAFTYIPLRRSAVAGAVAFVAGYLATFALTAGRVGSILSGATVQSGLIQGRTVSQALPFEPPTHVAVGWFFHNAHFAPMQVPRSTGPGGSQTQATGGFNAVVTVNPLAQTDGLLFVAGFAVPVAVLLVAGFATVYTVEPETWRGSVYTGAAVFLGYAPLAVLSGLLLGLPTGNGPAAPDLLNAVLLTGFTYPFFLGAVGGWAAYVVLGQLRSREAADAPDAMY